MMFSKVPDDTFSLTSFMVSPYSRDAYEFGSNATVAPSSRTYAATNRAHYYRIVIPSGVTVYKLFWLNGATASTNNFQVGLYYDDGTNKPGGAVLRGTSTTASGANACQYDNITDTTVDPGVYWLAIWGSGTTATLFGRAASSSSIALCYIESSLTGGLPSTATPASASGANQPVYVFGLVCRSTP